MSTKLSQETIDKIMELVKEHQALGSQQSEIRGKIDNLLGIHQAKLFEHHVELNCESFEADGSGYDWIDEITFPFFVGQTLIDYLAELETEEE